MATFLDNFYAFRFVYLLTRDIADLDAFKLGIIDIDGNQLKKRVELKTSEEKNAFSRFDQLVLNIRAMLAKIPLGRTTIARYATAIYLIKDRVGHSTVEESFIKYAKEYHDIDIAALVEDTIMEDSENAKYIEVFGKKFILEMDTGGIDMVDKPLGKPKLPDDDHEKFAGDLVFSCDHDTFHKCRLGKAKYARYKTYVGNDEIGQIVRHYGNKYPKRNIILKNASSGAMLFLRNHRKKH